MEYNNSTYNELGEDKIVKGKSLSQFINDLHYNAETEFTFNDKKYLISGWINENNTYTLELYSIEKNPQKLFCCTDFSRQAVVEQFENAKIFENKTIYEVEKNITVNYG